MSNTALDKPSFSEFRNFFDKWREIEERSQRLLFQGIVTRLDHPDPESDTRIVGGDAVDELELVNLRQHSVYRWLNKFSQIEHVREKFKQSAFYEELETHEIIHGVKLAPAIRMYYEMYLLVMIAGALYSYFLLSEYPMPPWRKARSTATSLIQLLDEGVYLESLEKTDELRHLLEQLISSTRTKMFRQDKDMPLREAIQRLAYRLELSYHEKFPEAVLYQVATIVRPELDERHKRLIYSWCETVSQKLSEYRRQRRHLK